MTNFSMSDVLVVFALEVESQGQFNDVNVLHCGIGKVNAAHRLASRLAEWQRERGALPKLVLNLGSAGSNYFPAAKIINCTRFIQRDFDVTGLGFPLYVTPFEDTPMMLANGLRYDGYDDGICGTGDNFVTSGAMTEWNVVDMEAYALAKVCLTQGVPFGCFKYITDGADGQAASSWEAGLANTAKALRTALGEVSPSRSYGRG
jgi:adenosylhomocysteine nucleosidase